MSTSEVEAIITSMLNLTEPATVYGVEVPHAEGKAGMVAIPEQAWLPDGDSQIFRSFVFGPSGFWTMAPLRCAAKCDPFLSLDCARVEGAGAQS